MPGMDTYPAQTTPNDSDYHIVNDGVSGETKKITRDDYLSGAPLPNNTVTTVAIADSSVTKAKLAAAIFSGDVTTYTNPGSAGGTNSFFYTNLGGIKLFWGITNTMTVSGSSFQTVAGNITFPVGFFSTIQSVELTSGSLGSTVFQGCAMDTISTTTLSIFANQYSGTNGSQKVHVFVIGT